MQEKIEELLIDWEIARQENRQVSPEELCSDCPELLDQLRQEINRLNQTSWLFDEDSLPDQLSNPQRSLASLKHFCESIVTHGLLSTSQLLEIKGNLQGEPDAKEFARQLVSSNQLTRYQADVLLGLRHGPITFDRYVVLEEIEQGGMGEVYKALHVSMNRTVAIKILPSTFSRQRRDRFIREIQSIAKLNHPNIVTAYDANEAHGQIFLAMEYVDGPNLNRHVFDKGPLSLDLALNITRQIATAAQFAHNNEIIHRDIKPANILLTKNQQAKLLDLGIARSRTEQDTESGTSLTSDGALFGTAAFMSPEQTIDAGRVDARADIYSLGCTLFFLLTGKAVFERNNLVEVLIAHRESPAKPALREAGIPRELEALLEKMLAKNVESRFQSMDEVVRAIDSLQHDEFDSLRITPSKPGKPATTGLYQVTFALAGLALLALLTSWAIVKFNTRTTPIKQVDESSETYQNDLAKLIIGGGGIVVANTDFGPQELVDVSEVPQNPIHIIQVQLDELSADFSLGWLKNVDSIREISIGNSVLNTADANYLGQLKSLQKLELIDCEPQPGFWEAIAKLTKLETLSVQSPNNVNQLLETVKQLNSLAHLAITNAELDDDQASELLNRTNLRSLDLSSTPVTARTMRQAIQIDRIQSLVLADTLIQDEDLADMPGSDSLVMLNLDFCNVGRSVARFATQLPALKELYLEGTNIGDNDLNTLANCEPLEHLDIANNAVTRKGLEHLPTYPSLNSLSVASTQIGDKDLQSICEIEGLEYLNISGTNVKNAGLKKLSALDLTVLEVTGCDLSDEAISDFLDENPQCDVVEFIYDPPTP